MADESLDYLWVATSAGVDNRSGQIAVNRVRALRLARAGEQVIPNPMSNPSDAQQGKPLEVGLVDELKSLGYALAQGMSRGRNE